MRRILGERRLLDTVRPCTKSVLHHPAEPFDGGFMTLRKKARQALAVDFILFMRNEIVVERREDIASGVIVGEVFLLHQRLQLLLRLLCIG